MRKLRSLLLFLLIISASVVGNGASSAYAQKRTTTKKTTTTKKASTSRTTTTKKVDKKAQLRREKEATVKARKAQQEKAKQLHRNIRVNLDSVMILDNRIGKKTVVIDSLNKEISTLSSSISRLQGELDSLKANLEMRKQHYAKALVYMRRNRSLQSKMMFIFSAKSFSQMARRVRYTREYSTFQRAQAEIIKTQQIEVKKKQEELEKTKTRYEANREQVKIEMKEMEALKSSCQIKVNFLNKNLVVVEEQIKVYQKKEASLDAEIERLVQEEVEAMRRAQAERERRAQEARQKADNNARERARKLANAKSAQERARRAVEEAEAKRKAAKTAREREAAQAELDRAREAARSAEADVKSASKEDKVASRSEKSEVKEAAAWVSNDSDAKLSQSFIKNKGRLPMPVTGRYQVVGHYGRYTPAGLKSVVLDNKGIDIRGEAGSQARSIFDGVVSKVYHFDNRYTIMIRHGSYISVYSGLQSVSVSQGQKVSTKTPLGSIGRNSDGNYILQFQLRNLSSRLNPELWVR